VLDQFATYYTGMYLSDKLVAGASPIPLQPSTYFFRTRPGEDPETLRRAARAGTALPRKAGGNTSNAQ